MSAPPDFLRNPPSPNRLFHLLESGKLSREDFQAAMRVHAEALIAEMEEEHQNPLAALYESMRRRYAAAKLSRRHNEEDIREIFHALADLEDFPPASHLWNAAHRHVPLHCFFRPGKEPVFHVLELNTSRQRARIVVEYGEAVRSRSVREEVLLQRDETGVLCVSQRLRLP
jgi:hypothetical protein